MPVRQPRYSKEEFAQRGDFGYQTQISPQIEAGNHGKIVTMIFRFSSNILET